MSGHPPVDDLSAGYEALRAQAVGGLPTDSPRGRALLLSAVSYTHLDVYKRQALQNIRSLGPETSSTTPTGCSSQARNAI